MKLWEALRAVEAGCKVRRVNWEANMFIYKNELGEYVKANGEDFNFISLTNDDEWEVFDDRKYAPPFWRKLFKAINDLAPDYQRMLDSSDICNGGNCDSCEFARLCTMYDDFFMTLEYYNSLYKLNKEELPEDYE